MNANFRTFLGTWQERIRALRHIPPLLEMVWRSGRGVVAGGLACRVVAALVPFAMLSVAKKILDAIQSHSTGAPLPEMFWWLVGGELPSPRSAPCSRAQSSYFDALLADQFTRYTSIRVMQHASRLDLASYEDPVFYDKLERARVQATDRIAMIQAMGAGDPTVHFGGDALGRGLLVCAVASGGLWSWRWFPAFIGESHFAFLGYAQNIRQTPVKRQLDYLRTLGASKESAKELKLFALSDYLSAEYGRLSNQIYDQNVRLARRRLWAGGFLSLVSTAGYYGAYAFVIYRTVTGAFSWGTLQFLAGRHRRRQHQHSERVRDIFQHRGSIAVPHRPGGISASRANGYAPSPTPYRRRVRSATAFQFER